MLQITLHLMLIAGLLVCPVRCAAQSVVAQSVVAQSVVSLTENVEETVSCACCDALPAALGVNQASGDRPEDGCPADGCDCQNCICDGAISQWDAQEVSSVVVTFCVFLTPIDVRLLSISSLDRNEDRRHLSRFLCGRDARIAHQSFLI